MASPCNVAKAVEVGHIFKLGDRYTDKMGCRVLDANGKEVTPIMGCYGIGIERILTAAIEQGNDANGFWLPRSIAPFDVVVTITNVSDPALNATGEKIAAELEAAGFDVLLDDRDERAGVKFKDADLIGIPYRVTVGKKAAEGKVELVTRCEPPPDATLPSPMWRGNSAAWPPAIDGGCRKPCVFVRASVSRTTRVSAGTRQSGPANR